MDQLLEHFMPSLMALKKALPGRQPRSFRESFYFFCVLLKSLKTKNYRGEPKTFSKRKVKVRKTSIIEVGAYFELSSCPWKLCEP